MSGMEQFAAVVADEVIEPEAEVLDPGEVEELELEVDEPEEDEYAEEAKKYGWKPAEDFNGEGTHMSAEAFMLRGPGTSRKAQADNAELKKQLHDVEEGHSARLERMEKAMKAGEDARVEARASEIARRKRAAAEDGDIDLYDRLEAHEKETKPFKQPAPEIPEAERVAIEAWLAKPENSWFNADEEATKYATQAYAQLQGRGSTPEEALDQTTKWVAGKFQYLGLQAPKQRQSAAVDAGGQRAGSTSARKTGPGWGQIPAADRAIAEKQIKQGEWNDLAEQTKTTPQAAFAKAYWDQD